MYIVLQSDAFPTELDDDENPLDFYGVCDGSEILMNEVDMIARQEESRQIAEAQERKITEQERHISARNELQRLQQRPNQSPAVISVKCVQESQ